MGEVEFFDKIKTFNRLLTNDARDKIWEFILKGKFVSISQCMKHIKDGKDLEIIKKEIIDG